MEKTVAFKKMLNLQAKESWNVQWERAQGPQLSYQRTQANMLYGTHCLKKLFSKKYDLKDIYKNTMRLESDLKGKKNLSYGP